MPLRSGKKKIGKLVSETFTFKNLMDEKNDENDWSFKWIVRVWSNSKNWKSKF